MKKYNNTLIAVELLLIKDAGRGVSDVSEAF